MSGTIEIRNDQAWMPAGWIFDNVLELVASELLNEAPSLSNILLKARTDIGSGYLDLSTFSEEQFRLLTYAVAQVHDRVIQEGPNSFDDPSFFSGFVKHLGELKALLEADARATTS